MTKKKQANKTQPKSKKENEAESEDDPNSKDEAKSKEDESSSIKNEVTESSFRLASLAATLMSDRLRELRNHGLQVDLSDSKWNIEFEGALQRANMLLRQASERNFDLFAYQVFQEGRIMTEEEITNAFKQVAWYGLKSKQPVMDLMADLKFEMEDYSELLVKDFPLSRSAVTQNAHDFISEKMTEIKNHEDVCSAHPDIDEHITRFMENVCSAYNRPTADEALDESLWIEKFQKWCFPFEKNGTVRKYRPHEVFRFAAMKKWEDEKLIKTLADLSPSFYPHPPKNLHFRSFEIFERDYPASAIDGLKKT